MIPSNFDASKANPEHIEFAYSKLKEYCDAINVNVTDFVSNPDNVAPAAAHIHAQLPFAVRLLLSKEKITALITSNIEFIKQKAMEFENKKT